MSGSTSSRPTPRSRPDRGGGLSAVRDLVDSFRPSSVERVADGGDRLDVRTAVLGVLAEQPSNGYRIVRVLEERGGGERTPSAGAVYPTLQLLADEGLATASDEDGRRTWSLTAAGQAAAESARDAADRRPGGAPRAPVRRGGLTRAVAQLAQTAALAGQSGSADRAGEVVDVLEDARRRILTILARD